jgi:hypothetical protein
MPLNQDRETYRHNSLIGLRKTFPVMIFFWRGERFYYFDDEKLDFATQDIGLHFTMKMASFSQGLINCCRNVER